jgi:hypothetical protein
MLAACPSMNISTNCEGYILREELRQTVYQSAQPIIEASYGGRLQVPIVNNKQQGHKNLPNALCPFFSMLIVQRKAVKTVPQDFFHADCYNHGII